MIVKVHTALRGPVRRSRGFSLLEMLLAILVFAIMGAAAYGVLDAMAAAAAAQERSAQRLGETQIALLRLERELRQTVSAGLFAETVARPGLLGGPGVLEFSFLTPRTLAADSELRQMQYRLEDSTLYRVPLGGAAGERATPGTYAVLRGVRRLEFQFLDRDGNWQPRWERGGPGDLPGGVRVEIELEALGLVERWFELPGDRP